jgi:sRNA-binding protein
MQAYHDTQMIVTPKAKTPHPYRPGSRRRLTPDEIACLEILLEQWPDAFDLDEPVPLQIGIHEQIIALEPALAGPELAAVLAWYTRRVPYAIALSRGGKRAGLDGKPAGDVSAEHQADATVSVVNFNLQHRWVRADWPDVAPAGKAV